MGPKSADFGVKIPNLSILKIGYRQFWILNLNLKMLIPQILFLIPNFRFRYRCRVAEQALSVDEVQSQPQMQKKSLKEYFIGTKDVYVPKLFQCELRRYDSFLYEQETLSVDVTWMYAGYLLVTPRIE